MGLAPDLQSAFPLVTNADKPLVSAQKLPDPNWLAGFTSGEGCFLISIKKNLTSGNYPSLKFQITQHSKDKLLMENLVSYLGCGRY